MTLNVDFPKAEGYGAKVGSQWFRLAASPQLPLRIYTRDSLAERQDDTGSTTQNVLDLGYVWDRTNWSGGEGLDWDPRELRLQEEAFGVFDDIRYWDSRGVDTSRPERGEATTLRLSHVREAVPQTFTDPTHQAASLTEWYIIDGTTVVWYDDIDSLVPVASQDFSPQTPLKIVVTPYDEAFVLLDNGHIWVKAATGDVFAVGWDLTGANPNDAWPIDNIWYVKERLLGVRSDPVDVSDIELIEFAIVESGPPGNPVFTVTSILIDTLAAIVQDIIGSGPAIVVADGNGNLRSYVADADSVADVPVLTIQGMTRVPTGETPIVMGDVAGTLIYLTVDQPNDLGLQKIRLYSSNVLDARFSYVVGNIKFIRQWDDNPEPYINLRRNMVTSRDQAFFALNEEDSQAYLWRYDVVTGGIVRHIIADEADNVDSLVIFENRLMWISNSTPAETFRVSADYELEGYIISPNITFGLNTDINWIANVIEAFRFDSGTQVELWYSSNPEAILDPDDPSWVLDRRIQNEAQSGFEKPMIDVTSRTLTLKIVLKRGTVTTNTPFVSRFGIRGLPKHRDWIVELPINISDMVEVPYRRPVHVPNHGDSIHLEALSLQGAHLELQLLDLPFFFRGVVDNIAEPVTYISKRGSAGRAAVLQFRGNRILATAETTGNAGMGLGIMGIGTMGLGQN